MGKGRRVGFSKGFPKQKKKLLLVASYTEAPKPRVAVAVTRSGYVVEHWGPDGPCDCFGEVEMGLKRLDTS